jgi:Uma2 family endonuclease
MTAATSPVQTQQLLLDVTNTTLHITPEQFDRLCIDNPDLRLELTKNGELVVMTPAFGESGRKNMTLGSRVWLWNEQNELGEVFDSSTGYDFTAQGGGKLSPDVSWIEKSRLEGVSLQQFIPVVPDFVIELRSTSDRLSTLQSKMLEYQRLGVKLGLLINPQERQVEVYRLGETTAVLQDPTVVSCTDVLPGFVLDLQKVF